jgi:hypothetical protein
LSGASALFFEDWGFFILSGRGCWFQSSRAPDAVDSATSVKEMFGTDVGLVSRMFQDFLTNRGIFCSDVGLVIRRFQGHLDKSSRRWTSASCSGTSVARGIDVAIEVWGFFILSCRGGWFSCPVEDWGFFILSCRGCWFSGPVLGPPTGRDPLHRLGLVNGTFRMYQSESWKRCVLISTDEGFVIRSLWTLPLR